MDYKFGLRLFDKLAFEHHRTEPVDLARDVMVAIHELYAADFGTWLNGLRSTFHGERFDDYHTVAILQDIPIGVIYGAFLCDIVRIPFVATFRTH